MSQHKAIWFKPFEVTDLRVMDLLTDESSLIQQDADMLAACGFGVDQHKACGVSGYGYGPDNDPGYLCLGGWEEIRPGVIRGFFVLDKNALKHPKAFVRVVKTWLRFLENRDWIESMETTSLAKPHIDKWMEQLGFTCVGNLKGYNGTGKDYRLWRRSKVDGVWRRI